MLINIEILDDAEDDIANGIYFYESQNQGLGAYFLDTILATFLVTGSVSYLYYANRVFQLPLHFSPLPSL